MKLACLDLEIEPKNVAMIGDRPLSDILAGKNAKMTTVLVDSISKNEESSIVRFARFLERLTISTMSFLKERELRESKADLRFRMRI